MIWPQSINLGIFYILFTQFSVTNFSFGFLFQLLRLRKINRKNGEDIWWISFLKRDLTYSYSCMNIIVNHWGIVKCVRIILFAKNLSRGSSNRILHGQKWSGYIVWLLSFQKIKQVGFHVTWIQQLW